jgi:hypothetical protein
VSRLTKDAGDKLAKDLGAQDRLRDQITEAEDTMRSLGMVDYTPDQSRPAWNVVRSLSIPDADKRKITSIVTLAYDAWDKLNDLTIARNKTRTDFIGNLYTVGDLVTWPVGSGSSSASLRIGRVVEFRNNGAVAIMPLTGRWGGEPRIVCVGVTVGYIVCVTDFATNIEEEDSP